MHILKAYFRRNSLRLGWRRLKITTLNHCLGHGMSCNFNRQPVAHKITEACGICPRHVITSPPADP